MEKSSEESEFVLKKDELLFLITLLNYYSSQSELEEDTVLYKLIENILSKLHKIKKSYEK